MVALAAQRRLRRFWEDLSDKRTDLTRTPGDKPTEWTVAGVLTLLAGAATQLGALSDWADRVFLGLGGGWALVSKVTAQAVAIGISYRVFTKTKLINSGVEYSIPQYSYASSVPERLAAKALFVFVLFFSVPAFAYTEFIKGFTSPLLLHGTCICSATLTPLSRAVVQLRDREGQDLFTGPKSRTDDDGIFNAERRGRWPLPYLFVFGEPPKEYVAFFRDADVTNKSIQVQVDCKGAKQ